MPGATYDVIIPCSGNRYISYLRNSLGAIRTQRLGKVAVYVVCLYDQEEDFAPLREVCHRYDASLLSVAGKHPAFCAPRARNIGTRAGSNEIVLHMDSDIVLHPETFDELDRLFVREDIVVVLSVYLMQDMGPESPIFSIRDVNRFEHTCQTGKFSPLGYGAVAARRADIEAMRGHDERFYGPWADDVDFIRRLERMGRKTVKTIDECGFGVMHQHHGYSHVPGGIPGGRNKFTVRNRELLASSKDIVRNPDTWGDLP